MNYDSRAWIVWILVAAFLTIVVDNPLYVIIILLIARIVLFACAAQSNEFSLPIWRLGLAILAFSAIYNALFVHIGETIVLRLPADWPLLGGPVTLEAIVDGANNGLMLLTLLAVFLALNAIVPVSDMIRLTPTALRDLGVVALIAITYVPETRRHMHRIREAQAIRGHQLRGLRDWKPVVVPLLIGGLERSMGLAETMVARGYGATSSNHHGWLERLSFLAALIVTFIGWTLSFWLGWPGWILIIAGLGVLVILLWRRSSRARRTSYRQRPWRLHDAIPAGAALFALLLVFLLNAITDTSSLSYSPYPRLSFPAFDWWMGLALLLMAFPAFTIRILVRNRVGASR